MSWPEVERDSFTPKQSIADDLSLEYSAHLLLKERKFETGSFLQSEIEELC